MPLLGEEFLPNFREYDFLMHWVEKPGTSLEAMRRITERASKELRAIPGVRNFGSHIGRAEVADEVVGPNFTELWISLDPDGRLRRDGREGPGGRRRLSGPVPRPADLSARAHQGSADRRQRDHRRPHLRAGSRRLQAHAAAVRDALAPIDGVVDLKVQPQVLVPQIEVKFQPERAERLGLTAGDVRRAVTTLVQGTKVGEFFEDQRFFDVVVWGTPEARGSIDAVRALRIAGAGRQHRAAERGGRRRRSRRRRTRSRARTARAAST